jgi:hypothetical protein
MGFTQKASQAVFAVNSGLCSERSKQQLKTSCFISQIGSWPNQYGRKQLLKP